MKYKFILVIACFPLWLEAQECSQEQLRQKPGTWKAGRQGSIANVAPADLAKEKSVMASVHKMVSTGYKPVGCEISYNTVYGKHPGTGQVFIGDPYNYSMYILRYLCDPGSADRAKSYVDHATPTTVNISANVIYPINTLYAANLPADDFRGYLKLNKRPELKDGFYFMGEEVVGDSHLKNKIKEYRWLITYGDTLPFSYLDRKEYLLIQKKRLEKTMHESPGEKAYLSQFMQNITKNLSMPESELMKPAVCMWNDEERFEKFVPEGTPGSFIAIKPNPAYYRKGLPKSAPQFFYIAYKISHGDPVFEENMANIQKAVDFQKLKNMLGK